MGDAHKNRGNLIAAGRSSISDGRWSHQGDGMARTERLIELFIKLQTRPRFTVQELATELGVSRRTMLRDLHALSGMGVPLFSTPGPHGGYELISRQRLLPLALTVDEASGILLSYEAFLRYAQSPFTAQSLSAITKVRNALPPDIVHELDRIRRHVAVLEPRPPYQAPLLAEILQAALDGVHLRIVYNSRSGVSERVIYPFGLYASQGFWYCACYDYQRQMNLSLRADRVMAATRIVGWERPAHIALEDWLDVVEHDDGNQLPLRARVTARGLKSAILQTLFGQIPADESGAGILTATIPPTEIDFYAAQLLPVGTDLVVESPPELIAAMRRQAQAIAELYEGDR
jgi:predicted DNA-binding transcriptional regulator YafY